jgi:hypothetical protein
VDRVSLRSCWGENSGVGGGAELFSGVDCGEYKVYSV